MLGDVRDWVDFIAKLIVLAGAIAFPIWVLIEMRGRRIWVSKSEFKPDLFVTRQEWKMQQQAQAERLAEVFLEPLHKIVGRLDRLAEAHARSEERDKAFGRSLDDLRDRIDREKKL